MRKPREVERGKRTTAAPALNSSSICRGRRGWRWRRDGSHANDAQSAQRLGRDFALDLEFGSALARRLFRGQFLYASVPQRMLQFMRRSSTFRDLVGDLFAGTQDYLGLKSRLLRNLHGTLLDTVLSFLLSRVVPGKETTDSTLKPRMHPA